MMRTSSTFTFAALLSLFALTACSSPPPSAAPSTPPVPPPALPPPAAEAPITVRLLAFNDFHGNIKPPAGKVSQIPGELGGAAWFGATLKELGAGKPDTIIVAAGDLIGASPLTSALFHDEPTVEIMNAFGLSVTSFGNHEFDEGPAEIFRMKNGGCHPQDGCKFDPNFPGEKYDVLGANITNTKDGSLFSPAYVVREVHGIPIAFVGMPLAGTPRAVTPAGVAGLAFADEVKTANALVPEIRAKGIETMVLLIHEGGDVSGGGLDDCVGFHGPIVKIVENLDPAYDAVISGHTHQLYNCIVAKRPVTSALSFGRAITALDLTIDPKTKDVIRTEAHNHAVTHDIPPDPAIQEIVDRAAKLAGPLENRLVGSITETLSPRRSNMTSGLGSVIADSEVDGTKKLGAKIALVNSSGIRGDIVFPKSGDEASDGLVTYGELFAVQPFGNDLVVLTITAAELRTLIDRYLNSEAPMEISEALFVEYLTDGNGKKHVTSLTLGGTKLDPAVKVRLTVNSYLAGRDPELKAGTDRVVGMNDVAALEAYFKSHPKLSPSKKPRYSTH